MTKNTLQIAGSLLFLLAFILIIIGVQGSDWMWQAGLGALTIALLLSVATHWAKKEKDEG